MRDAEVLEVDEPGNPEAVLIGIGRDAGIQKGYRGRLVADGETLAPVVIETVYPEGSRALIDGPLRGPITPGARVEIDVPVEVPIDAP